MLLDPDRADNSPDQESPPAPQTIAIPATTPSPPIGAYMTPAVGFPPAFYSQYAPPTGRPGEAPAYFPQFYITQVPPPQPTADGEAPAFPPHPQFYPAFVPYPQPYPSYMVPHQRPDGQVTIAPYPLYKPPSTGRSSEPSTSSKERRAEAKVAGEQEEEEEEEEGGDD
jgi:hypothetical protein